MIWKPPLVFAVVFSIIFSIVFTIAVLDRGERDDLEADQARMHPLPLPKKQRAAEDDLRLTVR